MRRTWNVLVAIAAAAVFSGCAARASTSQQAKEIAVTVERAGTPRAEPIFSGPASVVATHTYRLAFEIPGRVASVSADVGDRVAADSALATLADADYRAELAAAEARLLAAQAEAHKAMDGSRPQEKASAQDAVRAARAQLDDAGAALTLARQNASRSQSLFIEGAISAQAHDAATAAARSAQARVDAVRAGLISANDQASLVDAGARSEDRAAALAAASGASVARDLAAITLRKTRLLAPADAYVLQRGIETGDAVAPGAVVFTLTDAAPPDAIVAVPEARSGAIAVGTPAVLTAGDRQYAAHVMRVEPAADALTRTVQVRLHAAGLALRPGAVVIAAIGTRRTFGASLPVNAILTASDGAASVAILDAASHTVRLTSVHVLSLQGARAVVSGIRPGELIVTGGQYPARVGQRVTVVAQPS